MGTLRLRDNAAKSSLEDGRAGHALDACCMHLRQRVRERTVEIDGAAAVFDEHCGKALAPRIDGRVVNAEIGGEPDEKDTREAALAQVAGKAGRRALVVLVKGRVRIDGTAKALAQNELGMGEMEIATESRAR